MFRDDTEIFNCDTLELSFKGNEHNKSSIPPGTYTVIPHHSEKFPNSLELIDVPNREGILIHSGNTHYDTSGCILVGEGYSDINMDGEIDVLDSVSTLNSLLAVVGKNRFNLTLY